MTTNSSSPANFSFTGLLPSNASGYTVSVTPPSGDLNGTDTVGTINGQPVGTVTTPGTITSIVLPGCNNAAVGYNFLYVSKVARPAEQVGPGLLRAASEVGTSDFWAQGVNLGLELRY